LIRLSELGPTGETAYPSTIQSITPATMPHSFPAAALWLDPHPAQLVLLTSPTQVVSQTFPQEVADQLAALQDLREVLIIGQGKEKYQLSQALASAPSFVDMQVHLQSRLTGGRTRFAEEAQVFFAPDTR